MIPIYMVLIVIVLTVALMEVFKWLYEYIGRTLRKHFVHHRHFDECWKSIDERIIAFEKRNIERFAKLESRIKVIEGLAKNYDLKG